MKDIKEKQIVAFRPKGEDILYTGYISMIYPPKSKYNKEDYYTYKIDVILPIKPQIIEKGDKTVYFHTEVDEVIEL